MEYSKKRALITGVTGMVGSHLVDHLLKNTNWDIYGMNRWRSSLDNIQHLIPRINDKDRVFLLEGDLCDENSLQTVIANSLPDYVFHLAAQSNPKTSFTSPVHTLDTNILGTMRLLEAIKSFDEIDPLIHVCSSSEIFGRVPKEKLPINEDCSLHPASPYAISKIGTDFVGRFYAEAYKMQIMTTRLFSHTGARRGDIFAESSFAKQIAMIEAGWSEPVIKVGNLDSLRTWLDVRDAVKAYHKLLTINPIAGEAYIIGGDFSCTIGEMLNYLISISTHKDKIAVEIDQERIRPIDADLQIPDASKFKAHTGWKPEILFEDTMLDLLNYWREKIKTKGSYLTR